MTRLSPAELTCLIALADLADDQGHVFVDNLVRCLDGEPAHVLSVLHQLSKRTLVQSNAQGALELTALGSCWARQAQIRHRLLERFLLDVVGVPWIFVHREALRLTSVVSPLFIERVAELTRHATVCPHGNPIPGRSTNGAYECPVSEAPFGQRCRLARIAEWVCYEPHLLQRLWSNELVPGRTLVRVPDPLHQWVVQVNERPLVVGKRIAEMLYVVVD
ncbi:metal-dependent transcriptional regulator [Chloroflexus sp.]|uniref:metal-dependent transcriptional regulator n=1 Tax=Chloroflexus sp. TaxID=1904827 RepID=UPI00262D3FED|nr:metal-dependent transcriptional regulator [uncultured Chloroflexus sp.]